MITDKTTHNERFIRWQRVLREHLSYLNNLILIFSVGILGFLISLLKDNEFQPICCEKLFFTFGMLMIILSILFGITVSFCRLFDLRTTLKKIRNEDKGNFNESDDLKYLMNFYGKVTWYLLKLQMIFFSISTISLTISFIAIYHDKLF